MINKTLRRLAVGAAAITVAGVVVPVALAPSASAATPQTLSVSPTTQNAAAGGTLTYTVTPSPSNPTNGVNFDVYSGPDSNPAAPFAGTACTTADVGVTYTCSFTNNGTPGTDQIHFYVPATANPSNLPGLGTPFASGDPVVDGTAIIAGAVNSVTITPTPQHSAQGVFAQYTVKAIDSAGRPVPGVSITVTATQANAASGDLSVGVNNTGNVNSTFKGTDTPSAGPGTATNSATTATGSNPAQAVGTVTANVESEVTGTVNITAQVTGNNAIASSAVQTIDPGTANDVTSVTLAPASQNVFVGDTVTEMATLKNTQGDLVGGVTPSGFVTGANAGAAVSATQTTGTGTSTLTYTATNAGSDTLTGFVNQTDNPGGNTGGLDSTEPSGTASITVTGNLTAVVLTNSCPGASTTGDTTSDGTCQVAASAASQTVTFTLKSNNSGGTSVAAAGRTLVFTTTAGYTVSPASAVTDANGQATVTVSHTPGTVNTTGSVTATLTNGSAGNVADSPNVKFVAVTASTLTLTPPSQTKAVGSTVTVTGTATNALGAGVSGDVITFVVSGRNNSTNNLGYTGTCTTDASGSCNFTYTDKGAAIAQGGAAQTDTVTANDSAGNGPKTATVTFVAGTATAASVTLATSNATPSTQPAGTAGPATTFSATVKDANGATLDNDQVTFTLTGVGNFVDAKGNSLGTSVTVPTNNAGTTGVATVGATSTTPGAQTVTASADGVSSNAVTATYSNAQFNPITPERLIDSRNGQGGLKSASGTTAPQGPLAPNTPYILDLRSTVAANLVGSGATGIVVNVAAVHPAGVGNLRISPSGCSNPGAPSNTALVTYQPNKDVSNGGVLPMSTCYELYSDSTTVNVTVDLEGYYNDGFIGNTPPVRVADTRPSQGGTGTIAANSTRSFQISGVNGDNVPANAKAVALNVSAINPSGLGNLRVSPSGTGVPTTANITYIAHQDHSAFVVVPLSANGKIDIYTDGSSVDVAVDVFGYFPSVATGGVNPTNLTYLNTTGAPARVLDTRPVAISANAPYTFQVAGQKGIPANAQAVVVSIAGVHSDNPKSTGVGNLRAYPSGSSTPNAAVLNYVSPTADVANFAIVRIGQDGKITLYSDGSPINAVVDVFAYVPAGS